MLGLGTVKQEQLTVGEGAEHRTPNPKAELANYSNHSIKMAVVPGV